MLHATLITEQCYHISLPITRSLLKRLTEQERVILEQISLVLTEGEGSLFQTIKKSWLALCHNFHQYWHCLCMPSQSSEKPTAGHSLATSLKVLQVLQVLHFLLFYQIQHHAMLIGQPRLQHTRHKVFRHTLGHYCFLLIKAYMAKSLSSTLQARSKIFLQVCATIWNKMWPCTPT